jgi:hypothetical protein
MRVPSPLLANLKKFPLIFTLLACAVQPAKSQGTLQFQAILTGSNEVPPNSDPTIGRGTFTLEANSLSFLVDVPSDNFIPMSSYIQGPALPGANGPVIFDLGGPTFHSGSSLGDPPFARFASPASPPFGAGPFPLSAAQITELESGLWYVNVTERKGVGKGSVQNIDTKRKQKGVKKGSEMTIDMSIRV